MLLGILLATAVLGSGPSAARERCHVERHGNLVSVRATAVPLSEVLDLLAQRTGMKVAYDGNRPTTSVTVDLHGLTVAQTVFRLLDGEGLDYVAEVDTAGRTIETLVVSGISRRGSPGVPGRPSRPTLPTTVEWRPALPEAEDPNDPAMITPGFDVSPARREEGPDAASAASGLRVDPMAVGVDAMNAAAAGLDAMTTVPSAMPEPPAPWASPFGSDPTAPPENFGPPAANPARPGHPTRGRPPSEKSPVGPPPQGAP